MRNVPYYLIQTNSGLLLSVFLCSLLELLLIPLVCDDYNRNNSFIFFACVALTSGTKISCNVYADIKNTIGGCPLKRKLRTMLFTLGLTPMPDMGTEESLTQYYTRRG